MKKLLIMVLLTIFTLSSLSGNELKLGKVFLPSPWIGMTNIAPQIYVESNMSKIQQAKVLNAYKDSKPKLIKVYGSIETNPNFYFCESLQCAESLGIEGEVRGVRLINHIILTNKGTNAEIVAHEWSHEELSHRVGGFFNWWLKIPLWFDEGLASYVGGGYRYDNRAWEKITKSNLAYPQKKEMETLSQWITSTKKYNKDINYDELVVSYATAYHIIEQWYKNIGQHGLKNILNDIKNGKSFVELY